MTEFKTFSKQDLFQAIRRKCGIEGLQSMLETNPELCHAEIDRSTALQFALEVNAPAQVVEALLKAGSDVNKDVDGWAPLHIGLLNGCDPKLLQILIRAGAKLEGQTVNVNCFGSQSHKFVLTSMVIVKVYSVNSSYSI